MTNGAWEIDVIPILPYWSACIISYGWFRKKRGGRSVGWDSSGLFSFSYDSISLAQGDYTALVLVVSSSYRRKKVLQLRLHCTVLLPPPATIHPPPSKKRNNLHRTTTAQVKINDKHLGGAITRELAFAKGHSRLWTAAATTTAAAAAQQDGAYLSPSLLSLSTAVSIYSFRFVSFIFIDSIKCCCSCCCLSVVPVVCLGCAVWISI